MYVQIICFYVGRVVGGTLGVRDILCVGRFMRRRFMRRRFMRRRFVRDDSFGGRFVCGMILEWAW